MRLPTLREIFCFHYSLLAHFALLTMLFVVSTVQFGLVAVDLFRTIQLAVGCMLPCVAIFFMYIRRSTRRLWSLILLAIELLADAIHLPIILMSVLFGYWFFNDRSLIVEPLLIVCSLLVCLLESLLVYKLLPALVHLKSGTPEQITLTLAEFRGIDDGKEPIAGAEVNPNAQLATEQLANVQVANEQVTNGFVETETL